MLVAYYLNERAIITKIVCYDSRTERKIIGVSGKMLAFVLLLRHVLWQTNGQYKKTHIE